MSRKRVVIIGAGKRVQNTILPALHCLKGIYTIDAICSRTKKQLTLPDGKTKLQTITDLHTIRFASTDMIIVAATTENVPQIIQQLTLHDVRHVILFVDTPVVPIGDLWILRLFRKFRAVYVSEDFISLANYQIVKKLINQNYIGKLSDV